MFSRLFKSSVMVKLVNNETNIHVGTMHVHPANIPSSGTPVYFNGERYKIVGVEQHKELMRSMFYVVKVIQR